MHRLLGTMTNIFMHSKSHSSHIYLMIRSSNRRLVFLVLLFSLFVIIFRYNLLTIYYIAQTYATWYRFSSGVLTARDNFDTTMSSYPFNQTSAQPNYPDAVPAIIHHILIGDIDLQKRPTWLAAREACLKWHPNYEHKFWNDTTAEQLIQQEYPWFYSTWKSYTYPIQRADSLRYLVLYHYGGIFLDFDLHCRRSLGPLRRFEFLSPSAYPVGVSNGFLMASARHPFIKVLVDQLPLFNRNFLFPYATVMFSTGCMYLSAQYSLYNDRCRLKLLDYQTHRLSGYVTTPLFHHAGSSSWHSYDASLIKQLGSSFKMFVRYYQLVFISLFLCIALIFSVNRRRKSFTEEKI